MNGPSSERRFIISLPRVVRIALLGVSVLVPAACEPGATEDAPTPDPQPASDVEVTSDLATFEADATLTCDATAQDATLRFDVKWNLGENYPWPEKYCSRLALVESACISDLAPSHQWPSPPECTDGVIVDSPAPASCLPGALRTVRVYLDTVLVSDSGNPTPAATVSPDLSLCPGQDVAIEVTIAGSVDALSVDGVRLTFEATGEAGLDGPVLTRAYIRANAAGCISAFANVGHDFWHCAG